MNSNELAKLIAGELLTGGPAWLFLLMVGVVAGVGAYVGKYLETKGQNLATREDFHALQGQLEASTKMVEAIKAGFARTDWAAKEWTGLRIKKIEELMIAMESCQAFLDNLESESRNGTYTHSPESRQSTVDRLVVTSQLYLPELHEEVLGYAEKAKKIQSGYILAWAMARAAPNESSRVDIWERRVENLPYDEFEAHRSRVNHAAADLLQAEVAAHANAH